MRILTISKPYVAQIYRDKLTQWASMGMEVALICPPAWGTQFYEPTPEEPFETHQIPIRFNGHNHFHFYHSKKIKKVMEEFNPDILNIEEEHYSIVTSHLLWLSRNIKCKRVFYTWQNIDKQYPPPFSNFESYSFKHCQGALCGNQEAADILVKKSYKGALGVIPQMGVGLNRFHSIHPKEEDRKLVGLDEDAFWVGYFGRLVEEKGLFDLMNAFSKLKHPNKRLLIIGSGPLQDNLDQMAEHLEIFDVYKRLPQVSSDKIANYMRALDVFCLPSHTKHNWKEQFGRVLIEAMASSTNIVGSSSGEIPQVIDETGLIFREADVSDLTAKLQKLADDPALRIQLREAAFTRVSQKFTQQKVAEQFIEFFAKL
jgi:glycosyltransferase involved in cell wall biosynthesis